MTRLLMPSPASKPVPPRQRSRLAALLLAGASCVACGNDKAAAPAPPSAPSASSAPSSAPVPSQPVTASSEAVGPELVILPGVGISAIRFGTNFETLARHMGGPCEIRSETRCLYGDQAVDFTMKDGVVAGMKVYRRSRPVPGVPGRLFGYFKGFLAPRIQPGLHRHIVAEEIGSKPERVEEVKGATDGVVAREFYPGLVIEYDRLDNGNVVASTFEILRVEGAKSPGPASIRVVAPGSKKAAQTPR